MAVAAGVVAAIAVGALALLRANPHSSGRSGSSSAQPLLRILGVLRRPQGHLGETVQQILGPGFRARSGLQGTPVVSLIRLATVTPWGQKVFLVPFKSPTATSIAHLPCAHTAVRRAAASQ